VEQQPAKENIQKSKGHEGVENELLIIPEQKEILLNFLKESGKHSLSEDVEVPDYGKATLAEQLLAIDLPRNDWSSDVKVGYPEYPYVPDMERRNAVIQEAGLAHIDNLSLHQFSVVLSRNSSDAKDMLDVKIISLV